MVSNVSRSCIKTFDPEVGCQYEVEAVGMGLDAAFCKLFCKQNACSEIRMYKRIKMNCYFVLISEKELKDSN